MVIKKVLSVTFAILVFLIVMAGITTIPRRVFDASETKD